MTEENTGVWVVAERDYYEYIERIYATEIEALRKVNEQGYGEVKFVRWGSTLQEMDE